MISWKKINPIKVNRIIKRKGLSVESFDDILDVNFSSKDIKHAMRNYRMTPKLLTEFCKYFDIAEEEIV